MTVKTFKVRTTDGDRWGLRRAKDGQVLVSATARWKTERGAVRFAERHGYEVAR